MSSTISQRINVPEKWQNQEEYLHNRQLKRNKESLAGLAFIGYIDAREAYRLKQEIHWTEKRITTLQIIASDYNGIVELAMYPKIKVDGRAEPILEIIDWLEFSFVLIPISFGPKSSLLKEVLEKLELE